MTKSEIQKLHKNAVVCLSYVNPSITYGRGGKVSVRDFFTKTKPGEEASIPQMLRGGVDVVVLSHGVERQRFPGAMGVEFMLRCFDALISEIDGHPKLKLVLTRRDLDESIRSRKMGIVLHISGSSFNNELAVLRSYFRLGVRMAHPFGDDQTLGGCAGWDKAVGLQPLGREVIQEMERLGMLVDLAHTNDRTFAEAIRFAKKPLIDSHTNCRAIADYPRCCTDEQLRTLAKQGGVIGVVFGFVEKLDYVEDAKTKQRLRAFYKKYAWMERKYKDPYEFMSHRWDPREWPRSLGGSVDDGTKIHRAKISQLGDHIEHMVKVAGINHVCIGSDYAGGTWPEGVETAASLVNLTREMVRRGFNPGEIEKIWGGNFLRVLRQTLPE